MTINTAFVHDWILPGGALNVFKNLIKEEFKTAHSSTKNKTNNNSNRSNNKSKQKIFTLSTDRPNLEINCGDDLIKIEIITALPKWLNKVFQYFSFHKVPVLSFFFDYRNLMFFYPYLMKRLSKKIKRSGSKNIVISSFAIAKNISLPADSTSFLYLHSPMQYIRSHHIDYIKKLHGFKLFLFKAITRNLRKWDLKYHSYDKVQANSKYTAKLAKEIYNIDAEVNYPKVSESFLLENLNVNNKGDTNNYYVFLGRLTKLVRETDQIIALFNKVKLPLFVIGSGPDELELKTIAGDTIIFLGRIDDEKEKINILKNSKGLINLTKESFGLNTIEALLLGVPVFGLNSGATPELLNNDSGVLVDKKNFDHLDQKFLEFVNTKRNREKIAKNIKKLLSS